MLLLIEQIATQGLLFFMTIAQTIYHSFTKKEIIPADSVNVPLWGIHAIQKELICEEPVVYAASEMTNDQEQFFQSFFNSVAISVQEDCSNEAPPEAIDSDMLTMDAWEDTPARVEVSQRLSAKANARIADHLVGEQLWVVEVVGEEQGYLHVSDGSGRAWVEALTFGTFDKGDILSILVERTEENILSTKALDILQKKSFDFAIEDYYSLDSNDDYQSFAS